jgi:hypothetical protein
LESFFDEEELDADDVFVSSVFVVVSVLVTTEFMINFEL